MAENVHGMVLNICRVYRPMMILEVKTEHCMEGVEISVSSCMRVKISVTLDHYNCKYKATVPPIMTYALETRAET
jgi:hypothetical protein